MNIRNLVGGTVQGALGGVALLEEVHHCGVGDFEIRPCFMLAGPEYMNSQCPICSLCVHPCSCSAIMDPYHS